MMAGDDDLAALSEQIALASSAAISASDLDHAFQLQLAEAIQASLLVPGPNAAAASSSSQAAPALLVPESSSDAAYAFAIQAADLACAEQDRRDAKACRAAHARAAASARVAAHDAFFARELAAIPEDQWAHDGDYFERPLESDKSHRPLFRVFSKGMASREVVGPRDRDPSVAVLAAAYLRAAGGGAAQDTQAGGALCGWPHDGRGDGAHGRPRRRAGAGHPQRHHRHRLPAAVQPCMS